MPDDDAIVERVTRDVFQTDIRPGDKCRLGSWLQALFEDDYPTREEREKAKAAAIRSCVLVARAAIAAYRAAIDEVGMVIVPREPTEAMWSNGRGPILDRDICSPPEIVVERSWFDASKDVPPRKDGHCPKGDTAVWVYRAMIAAHESD